MIDAAERLAAEQGLAAMTLREVQTTAGQRNKSAAQYHFGDRRGLIEAIAATRMGPINEVRRRLLDDVDDLAGRGGAIEVRDLVSVLAVPLAEATMRPGSCWARFLFQGLADPELSEIVRRSFEAGPFRDVRQRLVDAATTVPDELRGRRVDHAIGVLVMSLAATETALNGNGPTPIPIAEQVVDLVDMCTAVIEAPASKVAGLASSPSSRRSA